METPVDANPVSKPIKATIAPGWRTYTGRQSKGADDVQDVITLLNGVDISACVVGVNALRYYGAGRVTWVGPSASCQSNSIIN